MEFASISAARGQLRPESDLDILVEFLPGQLSTQLPDIDSDFVLAAARAELVDRSD